MGVATSVCPSHSGSEAPKPDPSRQDKPQNNNLSVLVANASHWLAVKLDAKPRPTYRRLIITGTAIFLLAVGVSLLHWQDSHEEIVGGKVSLSGVFERYRKEARRIIEEGGVLFPRELPDPGNARMLAHPPGYSILIAGLYTVNDDIVRSLWFVQIVGAGAAAVLVFLIAARLLGWGTGLISAMLVALSPHLAYYSLILTPDSLAVLPLLCAIYLVIITFEHPRIINMVVAGSLIGLSCWLTANAMLLAPFLCVALFFIFERSKRMVLAAAVVGSMIIVIAPLIIRNAIVFHRFVPISIQTGLSLVEGIGDYDKDGRLGMPRSDREAREKDAEWNGRADYSSSLWYPDGIDRDQIRLGRGLTVIRSNPGWFMRVCLDRAAFMLSYNDSRAREFPFNTAHAPRVLAEPPYGHPLEINNDSQATGDTHPAVLVLNGATIPGKLAVGNARQPVTSLSPDDLRTTGALISKATVSLGQTLQISGDNSAYGDQFSSAPIAVQRYTDYVLVLPVHLLSADMAFKVTSVDRRKTLAITSVAEVEREAASAIESAVVDPSVARPLAAIQLPFASGDRTEVRLVVSNNGAAPAPPAAQLGKADIFERGATPYTWTRYPRAVVGRIQRNFTTIILRTLICLGMAFLLLARRTRALVILLAVPAYYLSIQSPLHTEYRYILAIHYFMFVIAGVALVCSGTAMGQVIRSAINRFAVSPLSQRVPNPGIAERAREIRDCAFNL